jgi:hypothetical protein
VAILTREQILQAADILTETIPVPEWGGEVIVKMLTGKERGALEFDSLTQDGRRADKAKIITIRERLAALSIVGEDGKQLFSSSDIKALGDKSGAALDRVFSVAARLSGITKADIEELEKNSSSSQSEEPGTA